MTKINANEIPPVIQKLGNNSYYYNYNPLPYQVLDQDDNEVTMYEFIQVYLQGQPDYKEIVQAVLRQYISQNEEFDLINSYNSYQNKLTNDESVVTKYLDYLRLVQEIKANVKKDFNK